MANKSFLTNFEFSRFQEKKIYTAIYTTLCVDMSVSVRHDSSFREEIGFIILHYKCSESFGNGKSFLYEYLVLSLKFNEYTHVDAHKTLRFALSDKGGR